MIAIVVLMVVAGGMSNVMSVENNRSQIGTGN